MKLNVTLASSLTLKNVYPSLIVLLRLMFRTKSTLQRYTNHLSCEEFPLIHDRFNVLLIKDQIFLDGLDDGDLYLDAICVGALIRYPVDWL